MGGEAACGAPCNLWRSLVSRRAHWWKIFRFLTSWRGETILQSLNSKTEKSNFLQAQIRNSLKLEMIQKCPRPLSSRAISFTNNLSRQGIIIVCVCRTRARIMFDVNGDLNRSRPLRPRPRWHPILSRLVLNRSDNEQPGLRHFGVGNI